MNIEQLLLEKRRSLPPDKQQEVFDCIKLELEKVLATKQAAELKPKPPLGERLRQIREEIVAFDEPLLDWQGVEREKAERRGGD